MKIMDTAKIKAKDEITKGNSLENFLYSKMIIFRFILKIRKTMTNSQLCNEKFF